MGNPVLLFLFISTGYSRGFAHVLRGTINRIRMAQELPQSPRYCLYARKSSEDDERQALSIDSQITAMLRIAEAENLEIVETVRESKSAKTSGGRANFELLVDGLKEGRYDSIITWAPDRLSRNA